MENRDGHTESTGWQWRKMLLDYQWIVRNLPYFLFLTILTVAYIYNGHLAEKTIKDINRTAVKLKELQYEYKTVKGELMHLQKESEVAQAVAPSGLREPAVPPHRLKDSLSLQAEKKN